MDPIYESANILKEDGKDKTCDNVKEQYRKVNSTGNIQGESRDFEIPVSPSTFRDLVTESDNFIDKTLLLNDLEKEYAYILIIQPPRWGKSLNLDMIKSFYAIDLDENGELQANGFNRNRVLFEGGLIDPRNPDSKQLRTLKIASCKSIMSKQGKYPVIHLVFPKISPTVRNAQEIEVEFRTSIKNAFLEHKNVYKKSLIRRINLNLKYNQLPEISNQVSLETLEEIMKTIDMAYSYDLDNFRKYMTADSSAMLEISLKFLVKFLYEFFDETLVYVLVDDYDGPLNRMMWTEHYEISKNTRQMILWYLNDSKSIQNIILTGSYPIAFIEGSDIKNLNLSNMPTGDLSQHFGFTLNEVNELIGKISRYFDINQLKKSQIEDGLKRWYNGYCLDGTILYNPHSVISCISKLVTQQGNINNIFQAYSLDSPSFEIIEASFDLMEEGYNALSFLISNKMWDREINSIYFLTSSSILSFLGLLLDCGFLTQIASEDKKLFTYKIPNKEVEQYFYKVIFPKWLRCRFGNMIDCEKLMRDSSSNIENNDAYIQIIQRQFLDCMEIEGSEAGFQAALVGCGILANTLELSNHDVDCEFASDQNKRFYSLFLPINHKSETMIIHIYKISNEDEDEGEIRDFALLTFYFSKYFGRALEHVNEIETESFIQFIIVRAIAFFKDSNGEWMTDTLEIKHAIDKAKAISSVFSDKTKITRDFMVFLVKNKEQKDEFIRCIQKGVTDINEFMLNYTNIEERKRKESKEIYRENSDNTLERSSTYKIASRSLEPEIDSRKRKSTPGKWENSKKTTKTS